eukprot:CAMPEP_0118808072 /NCGR_PEP_ID=MMETSP1161-20130426/35798_1 /TAXON_ID=249345 /ORGANISM="Picochlorum oklahomensis, Strain CCMP2329" /LENGTH=490 /DNA_ID=CAMNT_0006737459 /DNA_START=1594 /DNA_END=3066 /DNA_ORIENTATION=-
MESSKGTSRSAPVLPWMKKPIAVEEHALHPVSGMRGLDDRIRSFLCDRMNINDLFSIQMAVWELMCGGESRLHDVCFSAPTGSGKTLAYALPIVNALAVAPGALRSSCFGMQCLIVVPTRGLATQVYSVLHPLASAVGLETLGVCGSMTVAEEASLLAERRHDICIFTPGRLVSHLESTVGFSESLKRNVSFLVIDEADRLLRQRYNDWLPKVLDCIDGGSLVKYVVSATLTRDPTKLDVLRLVAPRCVTHVQEEFKYKLPSTLEESKVVVAEQDKAAALCTLLASNGLGHDTKKCIVFVSSVDATSTLAMLLMEIEKEHSVMGNVVEYSAASLSRDRRKALESFKTGASRILVCSDAMTRGMDIDGIDTVINYDAPVYAKTYVHRAGRTARAGRSGKVITLLKREEVRHFKDMLRKADNNYVKDAKIDSEFFVHKARAWVTDALDRMRAIGDTPTGQHDDDALDISQATETKKRKRTLMRAVAFPELSL